MQPPKPTGDGPDYENIAFHLTHGRGWSFDWTNPQWQQPYRLASLREAFKAAESAASHDSSAVTAVDRAHLPLPIADYSVQLSRTDGFEATTARPPLFPLMNACVYWLVPRGPTAFAMVRIGLAICIAVASSFAVAMSVRITSHLTLLTWPVALAGMITMALAALDRTIRNYATDFLTEPLAMLLVQLWLWSLCELLLVTPKQQLIKLPNESVQKSEWREVGMLIAAGVLLGLLILTRSLIVLWLPGVWLILVWAARVFQHVITTGLQPIERAKPSSFTDDCWRATAVIAVSMLVCAPWWIRNCLILGAFMPLGTQGPITLVGGYNDDARMMRGQWHVGPEMRLRQEVERVKSFSSIAEREIYVARAASRQVQQWTKDHWSMLPILAWVRLKNEWNPYSGRALALKLAALLGICWLCILHRSAAVLLVGILLINSLTIMLLYSVGGRFLVPTQGIVYSLAGIGLACTISSKRLTRVS